MSLRNKFLGAAVAAVAVGGMAVNEAAAVVQFHYSLSGYTAGAPQPSPENPVLNMTVGDTATLHIWVTPGSTAQADRLTGISLSSMLSNGSVVQSNSAVTYQAFNAAEAPRWGQEEDANGNLFNNGIAQPTLTPGTLFERAVGVRIADAVPGYGIRINTTSPNPATDSLRLGNAFLFASVTFTAVAEGTSNVFFEVGGPVGGTGGAISAEGGAQAILQFGVGDSTVSGSSIGARSVLPDAVINVAPIPEPASLGLLALGGLGMLRRRRA